MTEQPLITTRDLERIFTIGDEQVRALHGINLEARRGELLVITGPSGSGKTTLLNLLAGLDTATSGHVYFEGRDLAALSEPELAELRRRKIGFVFQSFGLLPLLSAYENVELPLRIAGWGRRDRARRTGEVLAMVGLEGRMNHRPYELSGGEQQRVAVARAIAHRPSLVLADEPTGELDSRTGAAVFGLLQTVVQQEDVGIIVASHDVTIASHFATRLLGLSDGTFVSS